MLNYFLPGNFRDKASNETSGGKNLKVQYNYNMCLGKKISIICKIYKSIQS